MPIFTLQDIAAAIGGTLTGAPTQTVTRLVHPDDATGPSDLVLTMEKKLLETLPRPAIQIAVVADGVPLPDTHGLTAWITVSRPRFAMAKLTALFDTAPQAEAGIHPSAVIAPSAKIGKNVAIGPFVVVGADAVIGDGSVLSAHATIEDGAVLGQNCLLKSGVRIAHHVTLGDRVIIHQNSVIGGDGFSFVTPESGSVESAKSTGQVNSFNTAIVRIASLGGVEVGADVEIGANTTIDRGTIRATRIGACTKIDNQVQIGHNVVIGSHCMICGKVGIAGSTEIGDRVVLGGGVGVADHIKIGSDAVVSASSQVGTIVHPKTVMMGIPAQPRERFMEQFRNLARLSRLFADVQDVKTRLKTLESPPSKD
jgi:UDP-3-O-[3-hydroxymyristoyl] glucosamine N-acyltransferase